MLENQVAIVTGAAKGIGRAIALELARTGATVIVNYNGSEEKAQEVVKEIESEGGTCEAYRCNVADGEAVNAFFADILARYGQIDILVNNAGITRDGLLMRMSEEDFSQVVDTNLKGTFNCTKCATKAMLKKRKGRIINISSVSGVIGNAGQANYSASKAGIIGFTKAVAREMASRNITVNAVAPGFIQTDMSQALPENVKEAAAAQIPLGHFGQSEDIANAVVFLASPRSNYVTGQVLHVDGGMAM
jgi:3-oxoacyl-[acyl-carrier protein] reductase